VPTIGAKVSEKELQATVEYANQCGETVSSLIRKVMVGCATMLDCGWVGEHPEYAHTWSVLTKLLEKRKTNLLNSVSIKSEEYWDGRN
jgi:hypothetical protein